MSAAVPAVGLNRILRWMPLLFLVVLLMVFGVASPRFLTADNLIAVLSQSSGLIVVALGMSFVLLAAGVDLSVGATMYLAAVVVGLGLGGAPVWVALPAAVLVGATFGALNGLFVVRLAVPAFIVTLATLFIGRGVGLFLSATKIVFADPSLAELGRDKLIGIPVSLWLAGMALLMGALLLLATPFGPYLRSIGADRDGARRAGVPVVAVTWSAYTLCGAFAGFGGFISFSQTSSASGAFGQNSEFLALAAAVLGGTSLFGGRGTLWAPVIGAILITTVQNGLVLINANPYAYPVITGTVIFLAAFLDSVRSRVQAKASRRQIVKPVPTADLQGVSANR